MSIDKIVGNFAPIEGLKPAPSAKPAAAAKGLPGSFDDMLENALKEVDDLQQAADQQVEGLALKAPGVTPHSAMVALEKADVAFQLMSAIRGKIIRAYEEVMRTQV